MKKIHQLLILLICISSCKDTPTSNSPIKTSEIRFTKEGELYLTKPSGDTIQKLDIEFAISDYEQETGLMYRKSMKNSEGMLFIYPESQPLSFYMKNTLIPLDIIFIDEHQSIINFQKNAKPLDESSLPATAPAQYVLEINAGLSDQWKLQPGDKISFTKK
ncbi:DUF192 domain-containing protein [Aquimarina hainanensis]|uniref:DUF192 domain-containing protein n=1 Tax=Aquimarina hainanensis TaxID=1578017 RepID=A0ABW5N8E1_9FLAO|nr:DUF192 domain-containing protein [Aquimarina sp. TRL1]QKX05606.1 DUF192 domain-containing protein [Aquimarina sp. TRL1]